LGNGFVTLGNRSATLGYDFVTLGSVPQGLEMALEYLGIVSQCFNAADKYWEMSA
jgi:hypothetical protein